MQFFAQKKKVNHFNAINLGKGIEMKNLDRKNIPILSLNNSPILHNGCYFLRYLG